MHKRFKEAPAPGPGTPEVPPLEPGEKRAIVKRFSTHLNKGQIRYLRAGHLDILERRRRALGFTDPETGHAMIDCFTSAGCFNVGRGNPAIRNALVEVLSSCDMGSGHLLSETKIRFARQLVSRAPEGLTHLFFAAGGGEAVDCALKLALGATGRPGIISTWKAYHGHTGLALSANGKAHYRKHFEPLMPGVRFAPFNDLDAIRKMAGPDTAAVIIEPVQGEAGIHVADQAYIQGLRELCDELGIFLIFDEVQTGFGRTGALFAAEHYGVSPDILATAKSMGGGLFPNGAVLYAMRKEVARFLDAWPAFHLSYSGGSDIGCRVSMAVLEEIDRLGLCDNARERGDQFRQALEEIRAENPGIIREVRGIGLMVGIEYLHEFMGPMMSNALAEGGVFAAYSGNAPQVMRFMLPLTVSQEEIEQVVGVIRQAIRTMKALLPVALPAAKIPGVLPLLNSEKIQTVTFNWLRSLESVAHLMTRRGRR
ncbi:aspartate aminotransferase family protein [Desulfoluna spongiiphila]|uniref:aspartate aminotransferase family protein n=1 Tax=Desulfoluna spongiiphila TaxID=419481 RepID=UPI00125C6373|nr:aspartate aminotransferase family protein [Desulfoluna spongiiphila]VVS92574.1 pyridoxal phosphate-dependent transferase [Desulfoluna spongiiphila]